MIGLAGLMASVSIGSLLLGTPSAAQQAPSRPAGGQDQAQSTNGNGEEVTVTARRRKERLLDVPVAATVVTPLVLHRYALSNLTDIASTLPNIDISQGGQGSGSFISIRGIGEGGDTSTDSSVSIDVDGISTDRARGVREDIFDLSSVDVLKGPQSLYFGKNSPAGVVVLTSVNPTDQFEGYAKAGYEFGSQELYGEAAVGGPVNDQLKLRIAVRGDNMFGGWVYNNAIPRDDPAHPGETLPGNPNRYAPEWKTGAGRFTAVWQPTTNFDANFKFLYMHYQDNGSASLGEIVRCVPGTAGGSDLGMTDSNSGCTLNGVTDHGQNPAVRLAAWNMGGPDYSKTDSAITGLTLNYHLPKLTLTSVSGAYWYEESNYDSSDPTVLAQYGGYDTEDYLSLTEELRAETSFSGPVNFTGGVFLQSERMTLQTDDAIFDKVPLGVGPDPRNGWTNNWTGSDQDHGNTESAFIQADYKILSNLELTAGVRYTNEIKYGNDGYTFINQTLTPVFKLLPVGTRLIGKISASNWSPDVTLTWHPSSDIMVYAAYKSGFQSGGFSNPTVIPAGTTAAQFEYKPELAAGEEVGLKAALLDGRLTGDITLFRYDYTNLQVTQFFQSTTSFLIGNAAAARAQGVEFQGNWQATPDLSFRAILAYDDTKYLNFPGAQCFSLQTVAQGCAANGTGQNLKGQPFALAPVWNGSVGFTYEHPVWGGVIATLSSDVRYNGGFQLGEGTEMVQNPFTLVDASLHLATPDHLWEFAVIGRNLANQLHFAGGVGATPLGPKGQFSGAIARPRQVYIELTRRF